MKNLMIIVVLVLTGQAYGQGALGEVIGTVLEQSGATAYGAVAFINDGGQKYQARTNEDGRFRISGIPAGTYMLKIRYQGDTMRKNFIVEVPMDGFYPLGDIEFINSTQLIGAVDASAGLNDLKLIDGNLPVLSISAVEFARSPLKNDVKSLLTTMSSDIRMTNDGELVFRGARKGDMLYLMDGIKTSSIGAVPSSSVGRIMVYSGGLPAKYGDTMGGVVVMESKSYFDLYRKWEADQIRSGKR